MWPCLLKLKLVLVTHSDGAAALVFVSGDIALKLGMQVLAKIRGYADASQVYSNINNHRHDI